MTTSLTSLSVNGFEQFHKIYEQIFGIELSSKANAQYITSGGLLNDIYIQMIDNESTSTIQNKTNQQKLEQLMELTASNKNMFDITQQSAKTDIWHILLPEYHENNRNKKQSSWIEWDRLLEILKIIKYYISNLNSTTSSTVTPNKNSDDSMSDQSPNQNININLLNNMQLTTNYDLTSYTPPSRKWNNLCVQNKQLFHTQPPQHRNKPIIQKDEDGDIGMSQDRNNDDDQKSSIKNSPSSPPPNQVLISAKKAMTSYKYQRGKNQKDFRSERKIYSNAMPKSNIKTKKCTPGIGARKNKEMLEFDFVPNDKSKKKLDFIEEEEENESLSTSQILVNAQESSDELESEQQKLEISMLSLVLDDIEDENDHNQKVKELEKELITKNMKIEQYQKELNIKTEKIKTLQTMLDEMKKENKGLNDLNDSFQSQLRRKRRKRKFPNDDDWESPNNSIYGNDDITTKRRKVDISITGTY